MTVSSVCSYSLSRVLSCLFSCCSVWFSSTRWDANASSSVWNSSAHQLYPAKELTIRNVEVEPSQWEAGADVYRLALLLARHEQ